MKRLIRKLEDWGYVAAVGWNRTHGHVVHIHHSDGNVYSLRMSGSEWMWAYDQVVAPLDDYDTTILWVREMFGEP